MYEKSKKKTQVPNCLSAEVSWCRIVPVPKCLAFGRNDPGRTGIGAKPPGTTNTLSLSALANTGMITTYTKSQESRNRLQRNTPFHHIFTLQAFTFLVCAFIAIHLLQSCSPSLSSTTGVLNKATCSIRQY